MSFDKRRLGTFSFLIGLLLWVVFFATDQSQDPKFGLFFSFDQVGENEDEFREQMAEALRILRCSTVT